MSVRVTSCTMFFDFLVSSVEKVCIKQGGSQGLGGLHVCLVQEVTGRAGVDARIVISKMLAVSGDHSCVVERCLGRKGVSSVESS